MSDDIDRALHSLHRAAKHSGELIRSMSDASGRLDKKSSSNLFGTAGGLFGAALGTAIAFSTGISLLAISTPLTGIGIISGILFYRGQRRFRLEKIITENRIASDEILSRIKNLPRNAPDDVKQDLWNTYGQLNSLYQEQARNLLASPKKETVDLMLPEKIENK